MIKVCKFGGTSMADGTTMQRVARIIEEDPARRYIVVSAPGKRFGGDSKVTDLLLAAHAEFMETGELGESFERVRARYLRIAQSLALDLDAEALLNETAEGIVREKSADYTASRGEYLSARMMASLLNAPFIDACDTVKFDARGKLDAEQTYELLRGAMKGKRTAVIPGFYGSGPDGKIKTFSRGGSDVSGAIAARACMADLYENWTDVNGFLACDPHIVPGPERIRELSYRELRELSYMGANVLHSESIFPVREAGIPILIKNTFCPEDEGTLIFPTEKYLARSTNRRTVTGIAGKKNFTVIHMEKSLMNTEIGFTYRVMSVLVKHNISFEHLPSGIDTMSLVIDSDALRHGVLEEVLSGIRGAVNPDRMGVLSDIALIAVVGHGMNRSVGTSARLFSAIADAGVNVRMIDQGSSELNIIVGVDNENYERTVRAVYEEFFLSRQ